MLFYSFESQEERNRAGGCLVEMQFCRWPNDTELEKLVGYYDLWKLDSLYFYDESPFYREYGHIFNCGMYANGERGSVDLYGINYYAPSLVDSIIEKVLADKPMEYEILVDWLRKAKQYNGFYIYGI